MNTRILSLMLGVSVLSLSGVTLYAQGYFGSFGSSSFFGMPSQEEQEQMYEQYQERMGTGAKGDTNTSQKQEQQAEKQQTTNQSVTGIVTSEPCSQTLSPVCGTDDITYANECQAQIQGVTVAYSGKCSQNAQDTQPPQDKKTKKSVEDADILENQASNMVEAGKKAKKSSKKSSSKNTTSFTVGPGPDSERFSLHIQGEGELSATVSWTGSAEGLQIEIAPREMPEKKEHNQIGLKRRPARVYTAAFHQFQTDQDFSDDIEDSTENLSDELGASLYAIQQQGSSPLSATLEIGETMPSDLIVTITSFDGEAQGMLSFSGDVAVSNVVKQEADIAGLDAAGKIIVPLVMYELDRYFKNSTGKNSLDKDFSTHMVQVPLAHDTLKIALNRYTALPAKKKKSLFNSTVLSSLDGAKGKALSPQKIAEIKNLLQSTLPPAAPKDLSGTVTLTDPDAQTAGKKLKLFWKHSGLFTKKYSIERAPHQNIEQILNLDVLQFEPYAEVKKVVQGRGGKVGLQIFNQFLNNNADWPENFCYRVRAWNAKGYSDYTDHFCPELTGVSVTSSKFNVKWTHLSSIEEADVDGLSDSDEPYLIFTMINGKSTNGTPHTWVRKWDAADDVDSGETEPDGDERASFTLFGEPPAGAQEDLKNLKGQLADTPQYEYENGVYSLNPAYADILEEIKDHAWGSKHIRNDPMSTDIDLHTGLIIATTIMEEDAGAHITLEEQIKAGVQAAQDIAEAFMDPSGISVAYAIKSTVEFMYKMWANDDYVSTESWHLTFANARELVNPPYSTGAYLKELDINGGSDGHYTVGLCLYKENTADFTIQQGCGITPASQTNP